VKQEKTYFLPAAEGFVDGVGSLFRKGKAVLPGRLQQGKINGGNKFLFIGEPYIKCFLANAEAAGDILHRYATETMKPEQTGRFVVDQLLHFNFYI